MRDSNPPWYGREYCIELMRLAHISRRELAEKSRTTYDTLSRYLLGENTPSSGMAAAIEMAVIELMRTPKYLRLQAKRADKRGKSREMV